MNDILVKFHAQIMIQQEENEDSRVFITCVMEVVSVERINY